MAELTRVQAIKKFFEMTSSEAMAEIKVLSEEEKNWFAQESAKALGVELKAN